MERLHKFLLLTFIPVFLSSSEIFSLDTNVFKYFPLKVGNRWTWYRGTNVSPGPGYESMKILSTYNTNNHLYYLSKYDVYLLNGNLYYTANYYYRIDSITGNLYNYNIQNQTECLSDSLNSRKNDSAFSTCDQRGYRCDTGTFSIFNQDPKKKQFNWSNYFEAWGYRTYALGFGRVQEFGQGNMNYTGWYLRGCLINGILYGDTSLTGINKISSEVPERFSLSQNYPNPFNPNSKIKFQISKISEARLIVYDVLGREVQTLVNEQLSPGTYEVDFDGTNLPSGVYYYQLIVNSEQLTQLYKEMKKMVLIK